MKTEESHASLWAALAAVVLTFAPLVYLRGVAVEKLWNWFAAPALGVPVIGVGQAVGLGLLFGLLAFHANPADEQRDGAAARAFLGIVRNALVSLLFLGFGAIVRALVT